MDIATSLYNVSLKNLLYDVPSRRDDIAPRLVSIYPSSHAAWGKQMPNVIIVNLAAIKRFGKLQRAYGLGYKKIYKNVYVVKRA
jgi:hypothetical protein